MACPTLCLMFWLCLWLPFIELTSTLEAEPPTLFVENTCIWLNRAGQTKTDESDRLLCERSKKIKPGVKYSITAGFAPGSSLYPCLRPKWQQIIKFPTIKKEQFFELKEDYCIYIEPDTNGPKLFTCINTCYNGPPIENPFYHHPYDSDTIPKWINPGHGINQKQFPDPCSHFVPDQSSLKDIDDCELPISSIFNTPEIYDPETATAENADSLGQTFVSLDNKPDLLATNPYFINDEIIPTANTGVNNPFLSAQPDTLDTNAPTQNWLTTPSGDLMNLLNVEKRARRSPRGFR